MSTQRHEFADGTYFECTYPWGNWHAGKALCADGKVRKLTRIGHTPDTFFSTPAAVRVKGKSVAGYVTVETRSGLSTPIDSDPLVVKFVAYTYRKNHALIVPKVRS